MRILGINETSHDAAVCVIEDGAILFAAHAERYSKKKNDWYTNSEILSEALKYGKPDKIAYYESTKDEGVYDAMNKGLSAASGDVIGILNSDDLFYDEHVLMDIANAFQNEIRCWTCPDHPPAPRSPAARSTGPEVCPARHTRPGWPPQCAPAHW